MIEFILAFALYFKEIINGNLDLFYFVALFLLMHSLVKKQSFILETIIVFMPVLCYAILQGLIIGDMDFLRTATNIAKIYLCIFSFIYTKYYFKDINFSKIINILAALYIITLFISLVYKTNSLWRLNDYINKYSETRLKFFYFEPSELAFYVSIIIIFIVYQLFQNFEVNKNLLYIFMFGIILKLTAGLGGIVCIAVSIIVMTSIYLFTNFTAKNIAKIQLIIVGLFCVVTLFILTKSDLYYRFIDIISGKDSSFAYRFNIGASVMQSAFNVSKGLGVGFGNLNTDRMREIFSWTGMSDVVSNSFMYFIIEGGVFSILFLIGLHFYVLKNIKKNEILLKIPLFVFIVLYQIAGGYFTNPINWIIYGILSCDLSKSKFFENSVSVCKDDLKFQRFFRIREGLKR